MGDKVWGKRIKTSEGKVYPHAWSQVLELEFQIRRKAFKRASQRKSSVKKALEEARTDEELLQYHFYSPVSLEAGAAAAREVLAAAAASSQSQSLARVERDSEGPPAKRLRVDKSAEGGKGKHKGEANTKAKAKAQPSNKAAKKKVDVLCMSAGKCIKFNLGTCTDDKCKYTHECGVCGDPACAAYWLEL